LLNKIVDVELDIQAKCRVQGLLQILDRVAVQLALKTFENTSGGLSVGWRVVSVLTVPNLKHAHIMLFERKIMTSVPVSVLRSAMALCQ
jgi:hypothetical protein